MFPTDFTESNALLSTFPGQSDQKQALDDSGVEVLSVWVGYAGDGSPNDDNPPSPVPMVISCWKLTREELAEVNRTGRIWMMILGTSMPPTRLLGVTPFKDQPENEEPEVGGFDRKDVG